jgi:hypothetical protein
MPDCFWDDDKDGDLFRARRFLQPIDEEHVLRIIRGNVDDHQVRKKLVGLDHGKVRSVCLKYLIVALHERNIEDIADALPGRKKQDYGFFKDIYAGVCLLVHWVFISLL